MDLDMKQDCSQLAERINALKQPLVKNEDDLKVSPQISSNFMFKVFVS